MTAFFRLLFVLATTVSGHYIFVGTEPFSRLSFDAGAIIGLLVGAMAILLEIAARSAPMRVFTGAIIGLASGLILAALVTVPIQSLPLPAALSGGLRFLVFAVIGYFGMAFGIRKGSEFNLKKTLGAFKMTEESENIKILDTSVIIDGRIADICETGFLEGLFVIPQFILQELQHVADSSDPIKRARGRRGLDILHRIQKMAGLNVKVMDEDFPNIKEVDAKLVAFAREKNAKVVTNDFNLNKVAELQGVKVLNINELSNAVKPVVLPGEQMRVFVLKEGKEYGQGVGYLDDGTMIVVESGRKHIGKNVDVSVTSVLQTTAGRMIFTKLKEDEEKEHVAANAV